MVSEEFIVNLKKSSWPQEYNEKLEVGDLQSNIGIAIFWSFKDVVMKYLDKSKFAILGTYYDRVNGLEPLIRNCLANPNLRYIILAGSDKAQSKEVLVNFFTQGFDETGKVIGTEAKIPKGIPIEDIEMLRTNVELIDLNDKITDHNSSEQYALLINDTISKLERKEPYAEQRLYEKPALEIDNFPAERAGFVVRGKTVGEAWLKILNNVYNYGKITKMKTVDSRQVRECINLITVIEGEDPDSPRMQAYFRFDELYLKSYYDEICTAKIPEGTVYTYGSRLRAWESSSGEKIDQIADMIEYLKKDTYRKSAIAQTWVVEDELTRRYLNKDKNSPCIVLVQPNIQDGVLHLTVYIRSNDMFRAWPLNAFGLRKLQKNIAEGLGVDIGTLTTMSCSAHIYQDNWQDTKEILKEYYKIENNFSDSRGYYTIALKEGKIRAEHYSPKSELLKIYEGMTAREINDHINSSQHPNNNFHSSYLGEELMKAQIALELGLSYIQDQVLDFASLNKNSCCSEIRNSKKIENLGNKTFVEEEIKKLSEKFKQHIIQSNQEGKDLFEHWEKPSWDEYFMAMAIFLASRSVDPSQKNGAVIVGNNHKVLSIGYNGFPRGSIDDVIPLKRPEKYLYMVHAERNAILNRQFDIEGATLYVTAQPCLHCLLAIIQSGIKRVVYLQKIKSRDIKERHDEAIINVLRGRKDFTMEEFKMDPLQPLYKSIEYYLIKMMSKGKEVF